MPMRCFWLAAIVAAIAGPAVAREAPRGELKHGEHNEEHLEHHRHYISGKGHDVHAPAKHVDGASVPDGATARCGDNSYSFSHSRTGTCSRHGGVAGWLR